MPADGDGNGRFSAAASRVCIYWPGESSGIIFDVELSLPGLTYFVPVVWMVTGLQQDQCLFQHWVVSESLQRHWAGNETEVRLTVKTGAVNWRNVPLFFSQPWLSMFFIKRKTVTDINLMRPGRTWPIQKHKGLKIEKHWKNAHTNKKTQRQHE